MRWFSLPAWALAGGLGWSAGFAPLVRAQPPDSALRAQQRAVDSLTARLREVTARLDSLSRAVRSSTAASAAATSSSQPGAARSGAFLNVGFVGLTDAGWSSEPDVRALQVGDHDPSVRGFSIPNAELTLDAAVDPYFKAFASIVYKLDNAGETGVELEEMFFLTTSLPKNLQVKGGQFNLEFGRQNGLHPHAWAFADQPLVLNRMFGAEGLRGQGVRASWLLPTSWYAEATLAVMNSGGATVSSFRSEESSEIHGGIGLDREVRSARDLLYVPRFAASFDLNSTNTVVLGASAALGPNNSGTSSRTAIVGSDLYWKWKSPRAFKGFPFVSLQTEVLTRRYDAARREAVDAAGSLPAERLRDTGGYAQLLWGIRPLWLLGLRGEYVAGNTTSFASEVRGERFRASPNVTWYPTEYSKVRLQYNFDHRAGIGRDHSLWLQFEFLIGAHAAHKF